MRIFIAMKKFFYRDKKKSPTAVLCGRALHKLIAIMRIYGQSSSSAGSSRTVSLDTAIVPSAAIITVS